MANALDAVLQMRREKIQREQTLGASIANGVQGGLDNFTKLRTLQQNQQRNQLDSFLSQKRLEQTDRQLGQADQRIGLQEKQLAQGDRTLKINEMLAGAKMKNAITQAQNADMQSTLLNKFLGNELADGEGGLGSFPPGTTLKAGPLSIPLNRNLTDAQTSAVAGSDKFEDLAKTIQEKIDSGVLDKGKSRTYRQFLAEGGGDPLRRILTPDNSDLEELSSAIAEMQKFAFSEGGKQLSPTELKVVKAGLSVLGKSDKQIKKDFNSAITILREKKKLALGGSSSTKEKKSSGVSEEDIAFTMKKHNMTREQVMEALNA